MSKLTKTVLKGLIKECLIELLAEGLASNSHIENQRKKKDVLKEALLRESKLDTGHDYHQASSKNLQSFKRTHLDKIVYDQKQPTEHKEVISSITRDPVMNEILADTLKRQSVNESNVTSAQISMSGDAAAKIVDSSNPEELFGLESSNKWASLAFAPPVAKKF